MPTFLTVKEAAQFIGKSPTAVRRLIYPILHDNDHPDRSLIQPGVAEALALRTKGENFPWRVSEDLLKRVPPSESAPEKKATLASSRPSGDNDAAGLLALLRKELEIKNEQITVQNGLIGKQMELINGLSERLREGNILIGSLQQRLALTDGRDAKPVEAMKAKAAPTPKSEKGSAAPPKATKPKPGLFSRWFQKSK